MCSEELIHNYEDTIYFCHLKESRTYDRFISNHILVYVYSGELILVQNGKEEILRQGESLFIRRNHLIQKIKQPSADGEAFKAIFIELKMPFLKQLLKDYPNINKQQESYKKLEDCNYVYLDKHPFLESLFNSIERYFETNTYPSKELLENKIREAVFVLLQMDISLAKVLFDFSSPWKMDLNKFMEDNYTTDLSLEEFAHFTGRSLSTFKREFQQIYNTTPGKWIVKKRLELAHKLIQNSKKQVSDICYEVGFKNLSHFSKAFKNMYGVAPTALEIL